MHIYTIDLLHGIAALMVVICHFAGTGFLDKSWIAKISSYGQHGVIIFFVISGFIIPYALSNKDYVLKNFKIFIIRRLIRLNPPYYAAIFLTLGLFYLVSIKNEGFQMPVFNFWKFFLHLTYLIPFSNETWYTNIYWTLGIEFQFYLIIGLLYPFLSFNKFITLIGLTTVCFSHHLIHSFSFLPSLSILNYSTLFVLGMVLFMWKKNHINRTELVILSAVILFLCREQISGTRMVFALFAYLSILLLNHKFEFAAFLGNLSYSLYLTHSLVFSTSFAIAKRLINFSSPYSKELFVVFVIPLSILFAYIFYLLAEKPAIELSKKFVKT